MRKSKIMAVLSMAAVLTMTSFTTVSAAEITESKGGTATQTVSLVKECAEPTFSVDIPASITITSGDAQRISYSIGEEDLKAIPAGKKVAITLADAGYGETKGEFALWNEETKEKVTYGLYGSVYNIKPQDAYQLGTSGYVSFYGNEKPVDGKYTMTRAIKVNEYDSLQGGTYQGYITYAINLINQ